MEGIIKMNKFLKRYIWNSEFVVLFTLIAASISYMFHGAWLFNAWLLGAGTTMWTINYIMNTKYGKDYNQIIIIKEDK